MKRAMKKVCVLVLALAILVTFTPLIGGTVHAASSGSVYVKVTQNYAQAQKTLQYLNKERTKRGLRKLKLDKSLTNSAVKRAAEVAIYVPTTSPHKRPNGKLVRTINSRISYECCMEGTYLTPKSAIADWMASPPHRKGILLSSAKSVGISCVTTYDGYQVWTLDFSNSSARTIQKSTAKKTYTKKVPCRSTYLKSTYYKIKSSSKITAGKKATAKVVYNGKYSFGPSVIANKSFSWSSSNKNIATVSKGGIITAKKAGTVYIKAKLKTGSKFTIKKKITVKPRQLKISTTSATVKLGNSKKLTVSGLTAAQLKKVKWTTSDGLIAELSSTTGKTVTIHAYAPGKATIKAKYGTQVKKCTITVTYDADALEETALEYRQKLFDWTIENGTEKTNSSGTTYYDSDYKFGNSSSSGQTYKDEDGNEVTTYYRTDRYVSLLAFPDTNEVRVVYERTHYETDADGNVIRTDWKEASFFLLHTNRIDDRVRVYDSYYDSDWTGEGDEVSYNAWGYVDRETFRADSDIDSYEFTSVSITKGEDIINEDNCKEYAKGDISSTALRANSWLELLTGIDGINMYTLGFPSLYNC